MKILLYYYFYYCYCYHNRIIVIVILLLGPSLSAMMVNAGLTTLKKIEETNPREIEMV